MALSPNAEPVVTPRKMRMVTIGVYAALVLLGIGTGYLLARSTNLAGPASSETPGMIKTDKAEGIADTKTFKDSAEGTLEKGGINGEGTHKLIREGGPSQTAYLVSSVVDLDSYVGKKVKVWGETFAAQKAAWLMDVGKIEVLE
ncbi:hypothetical protein HY339_03610 [Candidatus Gottesmanbacteria bacterium]|nr:hypothetical protein [Candidatus Gottesmanbacteria bacterium]